MTAPRPCPARPPVAAAMGVRPFGNPPAHRAHRGAWLRALTLLAGACLGATHATSSPTPGDLLRTRLADAASGATLEVPAGVYDGPFVINRPVRLLGSPGATLEGSGQGRVVEIRAPDVEVSGFVIRRSGSNLSNDDAGVHVSAARATIDRNTIVDTLHGIYVLKAPECRLTNNVIRGRAVAGTIADPITSGLKLSSDELCSVTLEQDQRGNGIHIWNSAGHLIAGNDIRGTRDGIYFSFCDETLVRGNVIQDVRYGLHYMYSNNNRFEENLFTRNAAGSALMYSSGITLRRNRFVANRSHRAYGLLMHTVENTRIEENVIEGNTLGIFLESCLENAVVNNTIAANYIGLRVSGSSDENRFSGNVLRANVHAVEAAGAPPGNRWSAGGVGNYWEDAVKLDLDRNGIADVPHHETDLFGAWRRTFPEIGLLSGSPGERAVRFIHTRMRVPGIPGVTDEHPLSRTVRP